MVDSVSPDFLSMKRYIFVGSRWMNGIFDTACMQIC